MRYGGREIGGMERDGRIKRVWENRRRCSAERDGVMKRDGAIKKD